MVNTRAGSSTGPTEMDLSFEVKSYLDQQISHVLKRLATKEDINQLKDEEIVVLNVKVKEEGKRITALVELIDQLEANNAVLESHVAHVRKSHENEEQYSRRVFLRNDGIKLPTDHSSESGTRILEKVKSILSELDVAVPDAVVDRAHRIGRKTMDANGRQRQQVIQYNSHNSDPMGPTNFVRIKEIRIMLNFFSVNPLIGLSNSVRNTPQSG